MNDILPYIYYSVLRVEWGKTGLTI